MEAVLLRISRALGIDALMDLTWGWPIAEALHFIGMSLLFGTVGLFDLRLLGFLRSLPVPALHRLVPFGVAGFLLNVVTGFMFLSTRPGLYLYNPAFQIKLGLLLLAGINMLAFYGCSFGSIRDDQLPSGVPARARVSALISLSCWCSVLACGRLITYYKPPYFWCFWCQ